MLKRVRYDDMRLRSKADLYQLKTPFFMLCAMLAMVLASYETPPESENIQFAQRFRLVQLRTEAEKNCFNQQLKISYTSKKEMVQHHSALVEKCQIKPQ